MPSTLQTTTVDSLLCLVVETATLKLSILPELGAKVISLVHKATDHEYLWRHPGRRFRRASYADAYDRYDLSGWDECFPTISEVIYPEEPWKGITVPDHGELWALPWQWDFQADTLRMWTHSVRFAYRFERSFHFAGDTVEITYAVSNPTAFPLKTLWSMHPFLNITPTSRVLLPPDVRVRVELSLNERIGSFLSEHAWPLAQDRHGRPIDLSRLGLSDQQVIEKLYTTPLSAGYAAFYDETNDHFLAFTFDPQRVPFVGVCHIRNGWPDDGEPSNSTILEPCTGWPDRLDLAMTRGASMVIPPQGEQRWQVLLHLGTGQDALEQVIGKQLPDKAIE